MPIRPSGVMKATNATAISHHGVVNSHGSGCTAAATLLISANQVSHCRAVRVASGTVSATWASRAATGVGATVRGSTATCSVCSAAVSSMKPASDPSRG